MDALDERPSLMRIPLSRRHVVERKNSGPKLGSEAKKVGRTPGRRPPPRPRRAPESTRPCPARRRGGEGILTPASTAYFSERICLKVMSPLTFGKASLRRPMVMCQGYPSFARVRPPHPLWRLVQHAFEHRIKPIYGDQSKALTQVERASDRTLEVLHLNKHEAETPSREVETEIAGILLYKDVCTDEFSDYGLRNSLEVKTLCLVRPLANKLPSQGFRACFAADF